MRFLPIVAFLPITLVAKPAADDVSAHLAGILKDRKEVPGLAVAAVLDGKLVATGAAGLRKKGSREEVTLEDRFHLGSCTKSMTATLAAIMVREGALKWSTEPDKVLKGIKLHPEFRGVTLEQLVSNTGGCPKTPPAPVWKEAWEDRGSAMKQRLDFARGILKEAPAYPPGQGHEYSNAGFAIAGAMLESAARKPYEELLTEKLFKPLGMDSAGFRAPGRNRKVEQPYGHNPDPVDPEPGGDNPRAIAPAGAVHCTITDWAKYAALHLGHGPESLLTAGERSFLHRSRQEKKPYALGWVVTEKRWAGGRCLWHNGTNTMWHAWMWLAPEKDFAVMAVANTGTAEGERALHDAMEPLIERFALEK